MNHKRIKLLALTLLESASLIREQDPGMDPAMAAQPAPAPQAGGTPATPGTPTSQPVGADGQPLTIESIVDKLNNIRGGKSFSDPEVFGKLTTFFRGLPDDAKLALDTALTEIGGIVLQTPPAAGTEPTQTSASTGVPPTTPPPGGGKPAPGGANMGSPPPVAAV